MATGERDRCDAVGLDDLFGSEGGNQAAPYDVAADPLRGRHCPSQPSASASLHAENPPPGQQAGVRARAPGLLPHARCGCPKRGRAGCRNARRMKSRSCWTVRATTSLSAGSGTEPAALLAAQTALKMRVACRACTLHALLPVRDQASVGELGLVGEFNLALLLRLERGGALLARDRSISRFRERALRGFLVRARGLSHREGLVAGAPKRAFGGRLARA